jgi:hypothetical protein
VPEKLLNGKRRAVHMERFRSIMLLLAVIAVALASPGRATTFTPEDGSGDRSRTLRCPAESFVVGFVGRAGAWVDSIIGLSCSRIVYQRI